MCGSTIVADSDKDRIAAMNATFREVSKSPFGENDQIGMLNLMTSQSMRRVMAEIDGYKVFDLAVDYFVGMPSWTATGEPTYQIDVIRTPRGNIVDNYAGAGREQNELVGSCGESISMYTHCGTHIDTLCHFGYHGRMWNGFNADEYLGNRGWTVLGAEKHPPLVSRGVLIDLAGAADVDVLPSGHGVGEDEIMDALTKQGSEVRVGDVVVVRTGRQKLWPDASAYIDGSPGLNRQGAEYLARAGAIVIGADTVGLEQGPSAEPGNATPVHTYLLAEAGVPIMEVLNLEELAGERVYEFAFVGACLRLSGATGSPIRPIAFPLRTAG
jgi:kynurenine formamidase